MFGCDAFVHVPKDERGKLDLKARKYILVGYGKETKAYRLYDTSQKKILYSRDVQFNEETKESSLDLPADDYKQIIQFPSNTIVETKEQSEDEQLDEINQTVVLIRRSTQTRRQPDYFDTRIMLAS